MSQWQGAHSFKKGTKKIRHSKSKERQPVTSIAREDCRSNASGPRLKERRIGYR